MLVTVLGWWIRESQRCCEILQGAEAACFVAGTRAADVVGEDDKVPAAEGGREAPEKLVSKLL